MEITTADAISLEDLAQFLACNFPRFTAEHFHDNYLRHSAFSPSLSLVATNGGKVIAHSGTFDLQIRVGSRTLRCAGIGGVATDESMRGQGLMDSLFRRQLAELTRSGFALTLLSAIPDFYGRYGFREIIPETRLTISSDRIAGPVDGQEETGKFMPGAQPFLSDLYNSASSVDSGCALRPTYTRQIKVDADSYGIAWPDVREPLGYVLVRIDGDVLVVNECVGETDRILSVIATQARKEGLDQVLFYCLRRGDEIANVVVDRGGQLKEAWRGDGGLMARVLDLGSCLSSLFPERTHGTTVTRDGSGGFLLSDGRRTVTVERNDERAVTLKGESGGVVSVDHDIVKLIIGSHGVRDVLGGRGVDEADIQLLEELFPYRCPRFARADLF